MNTIFFLMSVFFIACDGNPKNKKIDYNSVKKEIQKKQYIDINIDSISVYYWKSTEANEYHFHYTAGILKIKGQYFGVNIKNSDTTTIDKFLTYINTFYIKKTEKIVLSEEKPAPVSDYPSIDVISYSNGEKVFKKETTLYSGIEFNPKFLEFYEFLDNLVKQE